MNRYSTSAADVMRQIPPAVSAAPRAYESDRPCVELFGTVAATRAVPGFHVTERHYASGITLSRHCHENAFLIYGLAGTYTESRASLAPGASAANIACPPGVLRFRPPRQEHSNVFESGARCLVVAIEPETLERVGEHTRLLDRPGDIRGVASTWLAQRLDREFRQDDALSLISLEGILLEILADSARLLGALDPAAPLPRWLRIAREYAEANFLRTLSLSEIAGVCGVHRVHLAREFRRHFSVTVGEFLRRRRVEHACRLVSTTNDPLADVAIACGFSDQSHFCATFRRQVGLTPGRFREMAQSH